MVHHLTQSDDYLWQLILRGKRETTKTHPNTKFFPNFKFWKKQKKYIGVEGLGSVISIFILLYLI